MSESELGQCAGRPALDWEAGGHDQWLFRLDPSRAHSLPATGGALGDVLVVAVNDDDSVRRLKGHLAP